jgi:PAS domain S-box-containing protein
MFFQGLHEQGSSNEPHRRYLSGGSPDLLNGDGEERTKHAGSADLFSINDRRTSPAADDPESSNRSAEAALQESEQRLRAIFETAVDGIVTIDDRGLITSFNPAATKMFGYLPHEVVGLNVSLLMPEPYSDEHDRFLANYLKTGERRIIGIGREVAGRRKDGSLFPIDLAVSETKVGERRVFTGIVRDISERKRLERQVSNAAVAEQRRIGQDLHDGLCQHLLAISLSAEVLARKLAATSPAESAAISQIGQNLRECIGQARGLAHGLNPIDSRSGGLFASLQELCDRIAASGVPCELQRDGVPPDVEPPAGMHLYRIAQEAISNALHHGKPTRIIVRLRAIDRRVILSIEDNGVGIPDPLRHSGMGLHTMEHRARVIGAQFEIVSAYRRGTLVTCSLPLNRPDQSPRLLH